MSEISTAMLSLPSALKFLPAILSTPLRGMGNLYLVWAMRKAQSAIPSQPQK